MKRLLIVLLMICLTTWPCLSQEYRSTPSKAVFVNISPLHVLNSGALVSGGVAFDRWHLGVTGMTHNIFDDVQEVPFNNLTGLHVKQNTTFQPFVHVYLKKHRRGAYAGLAIGPTWSSARPLVAMPNVVVGARF